MSRPCKPTTKHTTFDTLAAALMGAGSSFDGTACEGVCSSQATYCLYIAVNSTTIHVNNRTILGATASKIIIYVFVGVYCFFVFLLSAVEFICLVDNSSAPNEQVSCPVLDCVLNFFSTHHHLLAAAVHSYFCYCMYMYTAVCTTEQKAAYQSPRTLFFIHCALHFTGDRRSISNLKPITTAVASMPWTTTTTAVLLSVQQ